MHMTSQIQESIWHQVGSKCGIADVSITQLNRENVISAKARLALIAWTGIIALLHAAVQNISGNCPQYKTGRKLSFVHSR